MKRELYISVDVETDGPIPGDCNMVSVGASVCGLTSTTSGKGFERIVDGPTFYQELKTEFKGDPTTQKWLGKQGFKVNDPLNSYLPTDVMANFKEWVEAVSNDYGCRPVFVAYPLSFDWTFTHWYFEHFLGFRSDPFGFSNALDIKTLFSAKSGRTLLDSTKKSMPNVVKDVSTAHTHNALDDAIGQGELFANLMEWMQ